MLIDEKSHWNILIYDISYKTFVGSKPLWIRFDKINGNIGIYNGTRSLALKNMMLLTAELDIF